MQTLDPAAPPPATRRQPPVRRVFAIRGDVDPLAAARLSASICCAGADRIVLDVSAAGTIDAAAMADVLLAARVVGIAVDVVA